MVTEFLFLSGMTLAGSWSVVGGAHIQAFTFFMVLQLSRSQSVVSNAHVQTFTSSQRLLSQDHGRLLDKHTSKHSHKNLHTCGTPWSTLTFRAGYLERVTAINTVYSHPFEISLTWTFRAEMKRFGYLL